MQNYESIGNHSCGGGEDSDDDEIIDWEKEAESIIRDVKDHVKEIFISKQLRSNNFQIYLNIQTLETQKYCIKVSGNGFQIVGKDYDKIDLISDNPDDYYETPYALLSIISQEYIQSFGNRLVQQMNSLVEE